jgi:hypothetical protein
MLVFAGSSKIGDIPYGKASGVWSGTSCHEVKQNLSRLRKLEAFQWRNYWYLKHTMAQLVLSVAFDIQGHASMYLARS